MFPAFLQVPVYNMKDNIDIFLNYISERIAKANFETETLHITIMIY